MRALRYLLPGAAVLLLAALGAALWVLRTEAGASWVVARATAASGGSLTVKELEGTLRGGLRLAGLRFSDDGREVVIQRLAVRLNPDLMPAAVNIEVLSVDGLAVRLPAAAENRAAAPPDPREILQALRLPLAFYVRGLQLNDVTIARHGAKAPLVIDSVRLDGSLHDVLRIDELVLTMPDAALAGRGTLQLTPPFALTADADAQFRLSPATLQRRLDVTLALGGDLTNLEIALNSPSHAIRIDGSVTPAPADPGFNLTARAARLAWPFDAAEPMLVAEDLQVDLRGSLADYVIELQTRLDTAALTGIDLQARAAGAAKSVEIRSLTAASGELNAGATGALEWTDGFAARVDADLERFDPGRWIPDWPEQQTLSGRVSASIAGSRVELTRLRLAHSDSTATVQGSGVVDLDAGVVDGDLRWNDLRWPLSPATDTLASPRATLAVRGAPDDWQVNGDIGLTAPNLPPGSFTLHGSGDLGGARVRIDDSSVLGGRVTGQVSFAWHERGEWSAELATRGLQLAPLLPEWPGTVSGELIASGQREPFRLEARIPALSGAVRGRSLDVRGGLAIDGRRLQVDALEVTAGESTIRADGSWRAPGGIAFALDVASLADIVPGAAGRVQASGRIRAGQPLPVVELELDAEDASWGAWHLAQAHLSNTPQRAGEPLALVLRVNDAAYRDTQLETVAASLTGHPGQHDLDVTVERLDARLQVALDGNAVDWRAGRSARWEGTLGRVQADIPDELSASLRAPVPLSVDATQGGIGRACLDNAGGGTLCLQGNWTADRGSFVAAELMEVPLQLVALLSATELGFTQTVDGEIRLAVNEAGRLYGSGRVDVTAGTIRHPFDERLMMRTRDGFAAFDLANGRLLSGEIRLPFSDAAEIAGRFEMLDLARGIDSAVEGRLTADVRDIGVAARLVPLVDEAAGRLNADIQVRGTLGAPEFSGDLALRDGLIAYDPLGLRLDELQVDGDFLGGSKLQLESAFRAGEGHGTLSGSARYEPGGAPGAEMTLHGRNLALINLRDLGLTVDPDLRVMLAGRELSINGRVGVPAARLASVNLMNTGESESPDVEFVGTRRPAEDVGEDAAPAFAFDGSVEVVLGDQVVVDLDVARARLTGSSTFSWHGQPMPQANGSFAVSGKFQAYGQLLEITEGVIRYPGIPANNPELRVRAEREIFGNSQVRRAGVLVGGTAARPQIDVYTTPATSEDRALSLLATGSDFNYEQGIGAVDVGTYIAPRLYASYGIALFDRENVISVRYDLAKGFGIKATSGKRAAGIDISYTIQN